MANIVRREHHLRTLRLRLAHQAPGPGVQIERCDGEEQLGEPLFLPLAELGLSSRPTAKSLLDWRPQPLPDEVIFWIQELTARRDREEEPLWLQLSDSAFPVALVPWERLLVERLELPILRIPNFTVAPTFSTGPLRVAICASAPRVKTPFPVPDYVRAVVEAYFAALPEHPLRIHVFADEEAEVDAVHAARRGPQHEVVVHHLEPARDGRLPRPSAASGGAIESPWLRWMLAELEQGVDAVHFICPGFFERGRGALALAPSPSRNPSGARRSHFVGANELVTFLNWVGAWSVCLSPPRETPWAAGLRLLAAELARARPGPLLLHDEQSGDLSALTEAFRFLYGPERIWPPRAAELALACHPLRLPSNQPEDRPWEQDFETILAQLAPRTHSTRAGIEILSAPVQAEASQAPRWLQSAHRTFETHAAQVLLKGTEELVGSEPMQRGEAAAVEFFRKIVSEVERDRPVAPPLELPGLLVGLRSEEGEGEPS